MPAGKTPEQYIKDLKKTHKGTITALDPYVNNYTKIRHKCGTCQRIWKVQPNSLLTGRGCSDCSTKAKAKSPATFAKEVKQKHNGTIEVVGKYVNAYTKIACHCRVCDHDWMGYPGQMVAVRASGCPRCGVRRAATNAFQLKDHKLGNRVVQVQGYEGLALDYLVKERGIKPSSIAVTHCDKVPVIRYYYSGRERTHQPDFFLRKRKHLVEVKSDWTFGMRSRSLYDSIRAKVLAAKEQGYKYTVLVFDTKGQRVMLPQKWYRLSYSRFLKSLENLVA